MATKKQKAKKPQKAKKKQAPEPKRLYLVYDETRSGGNICEGEEDSDWPNRDPEYIEVSFTALYRNPPENRFFYDSFEVSEEVYNAEQVYMAVVRYSDGDTFGYTSGYWSVEGIFSSQSEAEKLLSKLDNEASQPFTMGKYTKAWHGYFGSFEGTQVEFLTVQEK